MGLCAPWCANTDLQLLAAIIIADNETEAAGHLNQPLDLVCCERFDNQFFTGGGVHPEVTENRQLGAQLA
jgi:hypothetical protein